MVVIIVNFYLVVDPVTDDADIVSRSSRSDAMGGNIVRELICLLRITVMNIIVGCKNVFRQY